MTDKKFFGLETEIVNGVKWNWGTFEDTKKFPVSKDLLQWVIGQDKALSECFLCLDEWTYKLKWLEKRKVDVTQVPGPYLLLLGDPGTGKSLIGKALASHLTQLYKNKRIQLLDVICRQNKKIPSEPTIETLPAGVGSKVVRKEKMLAGKKNKLKRFAIKGLMGLLLGVGATLVGSFAYMIHNFWSLWFRNPFIGDAGLRLHWYYPDLIEYLIRQALAGGLVYLLVGGVTTMAMAIFVWFFGRLGGGSSGLKGIAGSEATDAPKLIVDNSKKVAPFIDACQVEGGYISGYPYPFPIEEAEGKLIYNSEGEIQNVLKLEKKEWKGTLYTIKPRLLFPIKVTENHPFLVYENKNKVFKQREFARLREPYNLVWKTARKLRLNDILVLPVYKKTDYKHFYTHLISLGARKTGNYLFFHSTKKHLIYQLLFEGLGYGILPTCTLSSKAGGSPLNKRWKGSRTYELKYYLGENQRSYYRNEKYVFLPIRWIKKQKYTGVIYNMESGDGTYLNPCITHNTGHTTSQLYGSIAWDPYQTGGMSTPEHQRVAAGDVHRANLGILYIDEIKNLKPEEAVTLLTVLEDGQLPVTLRSKFGGSGSAAMSVSTEPVPALTFLVAAGNFDSINQIHPALMDRIYGYGKVVRMNNDMDNTVENRRKYIQFISQEVSRFGLLPFSREACIRVIDEARRRSGSSDKLTTKFRPMISIIKTAATLAKNDKRKLVYPGHVKEAIDEHCKTIQKQLLEHYMEKRGRYLEINPIGSKLGNIYGLAVVSDNYSGEMTGSILQVKGFIQKLHKGSVKNKRKGWLRVTGIQKEKEEKYIIDSVIKVKSVILKKYGVDMAQDYFTHLDFAQSHGVDGPSAGVTMTLLLCSLLEGKHLRQDVAVTGEINIGVNDEILITAVGGLHEKIMAAQAWGFKKVLIPMKNFKYSIKPKDYTIEVVGCKTLGDYLKEILVKE